MFNVKKNWKGKNKDTGYLIGVLRYFYITVRFESLSKMIF